MQSAKLGHVEVGEEIEAMEGCVKPWAARACPQRGSGGRAPAGLSGGGG
eukprot:SAG11_NODE_17647_length_512_cov_4.830508_1_plen_48_part_10